MKSLFILPVVFSLAFAPVVFSQVGGGGGGEVPEPPETLLGCSPNDSFGQCAMKIARLALRVLMIIALILAGIFIAWAGLEFVTKGTEKEGAEKARKRIVFAAVGLVIAFIAWALTLVIKRFALTGEV